MKIKAKTNKWKLTKFKSFPMAKETINKTKDNLYNGRKYLQRKQLRQGYFQNIQTVHATQMKKKNNNPIQKLVQFNSVQLLSRVWLFATPWITAHQAFLSITNSWSLLKLMSIESVMPSSNLILCCPLLLLPPIPPNIRVFSNESTVCMRWPKYWRIGPSKEHSRLIFFRMDWLDLFAVQGTLKHPLPITQEKTTHGHHQMVNTEIRLIIFFAAKDGEALYSQQKQDWELTVAQIINSLLPNSDLNGRK